MLKSLKISVVGLLFLVSCQNVEGSEKAVEVDCSNALEAFKKEQERANFFVEENIKLENKVKALEDVIVQMSILDSAEITTGYLKSNGALKGITE